MYPFLMKCELSVFIKNMAFCLLILGGLLFSLPITHLYGERVIPETVLSNHLKPNSDYSKNCFSVSFNQLSKTFNYEIGKRLILVCDGEEKSFRTDSFQVRNLLMKEKIDLTKQDFITLPPNHVIHDLDYVQIKRVQYKYYDFDESIAFQSISRTNPLVANGIRVIWQPGEPGIFKHKIREKYEDGILKEKKILSTQKTKEPTTEIIALGSGFFTGKYRKKFRMCASSYNPTVEQCDSDPFTTATGVRVRFGVVAVDPTVIKLGSKLWVSGYGYAIAADTGGLIKKLKIDLFFWRRLPQENWKGGYIDVYLLD